MIWSMTEWNSLYNINSFFQFNDRHWYTSETKPDSVPVIEIIESKHILVDTTNSRSNQFKSVHSKAQSCKWKPNKQQNKAAFFNDGQKCNLLSSCILAIFWTSPTSLSRCDAELSEVVDNRSSSSISCDESRESRCVTKWSFELVELNLSSDNFRTSPVGLISKVLFAAAAPDVRMSNVLFAPRISNVILASSLRNVAFPVCIKSSLRNVSAVTSGDVSSLRYVEFNGPTFGGEESLRNVAFPYPGEKVIVIFLIVSCCCKLKITC